MSHESQPESAEQFVTNVAHTFLRDNLPTAARILEVGCGSGALAAQLAHDGFDVTALDRFPDAIREAVARGVNAHCADWVTYADGRTYDAIVFIRSLHHIDPLDQAIRRAVPHFAPHGRILAYEFAVDEIDAITAGWLQRELRSVFPAAPPAGSLASKLLHASTIANHDSAPTALDLWRDHHAHHAPIHRASEIRAAFERAFENVAMTTGPYLFHYAAPPGGPAAAAAIRALWEREIAAIAAGTIRPVGRRFAASRRR